MLIDDEEIFRQGKATKRSLTVCRQASFGNTALAEKIPSGVNVLDVEEYKNTNGGVQLSHTPF